MGASTVRDTADTAALITLNLDYCGLAYTNVLSSGSSLSVTKKSCATGYYSFGHEIGHNIAALHNPEAHTASLVSSWTYSYAFGHLIAKGSASTGARTVMAYNAAGHSTRVNYWSNPAVNYPITGTPTGVAGVSNNAALLTLRRYTLAAVGDESSTTCKSAVTTVAPITTAKPVTTMKPVTPIVTTMKPVTPIVTTMKPVTPIVTTMKPVTPIVTTMKPVTPIVTTMKPTTECQLPNKRVVLKTIKRGKKIKNPKICAAMCKKNKKPCQYWSWTKKSKTCILLSVSFMKKKGVISGGLNC